MQLTATMSSGWNYFRMPNPGPNFQLYRVVRSDGREVRVGDNVWTTDRSFPSAQAGALREHLLHLLDFDGTGSYTLYFRSEDSIAPAVLDIVDVLPNPQTNAVAFVDVIFSEPVSLDTFDYQDVTLTLDGGVNLVNNSVTIALVANSTYRISGLVGLTAADGNYELKVLAGGILAQGGNAVASKFHGAKLGQGSGRVCHRFAGERFAGPAQYAGLHVGRGVLAAGRSGHGMRRT